MKTALDSFGLDWSEKTRLFKKWPYAAQKGYLSGAGIIKLT
jgi:hypothetical protein